jgi:hypothetical protein
LNLFHLGQTHRHWGIAISNSSTTPPSRRFKLGGVLRLNWQVFNFEQRGHGLPP